MLAPLPEASDAPLSPVVTETTVEIITTTYIITEAPVTITVSAPPSTVTNIITTTPSPSPPLSTTPTPPPPPTPAQQTTWTAPAQMTDLSAFNISAFPGGQRNMNIVNGIPAGASATSLANDAASTSPADLVAAALTSWDNSSSVLQLFYPENSINPASKPQGGAEFYATPLIIQHAKNVSLEYSVFFPVDYDWVLGGKLPGLYGGHTGCSGGNNALTCFSTRLMWRPEGMGELYLYAPKAKQTHSLCSDPQSVCDATFGFSIGRGSFQYAAGGWTRVRQTVVLNTPGKQDGGFSLDVNGKRVIDRSDVFYRDIPTPPIKPKPKPTPKPSGILGPLLGSPLLGGPLLGGLFKDTQILHNREKHDQDFLPLSTAHPLSLANDGVSVSFASAQTAVWRAHRNTVTTTITATASPIVETGLAATVTTVLFMNAESEDTPLSIESAPSAPQAQPIPFVPSISTFFGGHEPQYATPKNQHTWFKDFALSCQP
ncbi:polysaccharide lyase family 14 protein [Piloderma croceum F 1598]|uniref:Polysaccharide lyase family 14 protein n=1 Tax=Piloderma croceum (strain F 1598) TaxID=765440 RepID=A0A0C3BLN0_PILCF|nr:polysaccharide lyase family 14 protein [Piloderma croceum F 1598]